MSKKFVKPNNGATVILGDGQRIPDEGKELDYTVEIARRELNGDVVCSDVKADKAKKGAE